MNTKFYLLHLLHLLSYVPSLSLSMTLKNHKISHPIQHASYLRQIATKGQHPPG